MNIIFFGTPNFVVPVLEALNKRYDVIGVVTAPDKKVGRHNILTPSPVKQFALEHNIPVWEMGNGKWKMENGKADLFVVAAYGKIIPQSILDLPKYGAINIHPSILPKYRGPSPITQTLLNGDRESAISIMKLDEQMDHGPLLKMIPYSIPEEATAEQLTQAMFQKSAEILPEVIDDYVAGKIKPTDQKHDEATYTHMVTKQDGYIDLSSLERLNSLEIGNWKLEIARKIRAYYPWPTVWSRIVIARPQSGEAISSTQEKIIKFLPEKRVQLEGGKPMNMKDFSNGYPELRATIKGLLQTNAIT